MIWLIVTHFVSDFVLQTRKIATTKSSNPVSLLIHVGIIWAAFSPFGLRESTINALAHAVIDWNVWRGYKWIRRREDPVTFKYWEDHLFYTTIGFDQMLHLLTIVLIWGGAR